MKKIFKSLSTVIIAVMSIGVFCIPSHAMKYIDGRFIKNTQVHECVKKIVIQHRHYKQLSGKYSIHPERICFSFSVKKKTDKVQDIEIVVPVAFDGIKGPVESFFIGLIPKNDLTSFELVNLFLNSNEFNEENFNFEDEISVIAEGWKPNKENQYDNMYSIITDITEENWREKFSDEDSVIPDLCPQSLMFFEINRGEKVFVKGYEC